MLKKLRLYFSLTVLSLGLALPASAASTSNTPTLEQDLAFAFGEANTSLNTDSLSLLTDQEMIDTEGEAFPWVIGYGLVFAARYAYTGYRVWRATRTGAKIYSKGFHKAHHNFGTRANPSWRTHYQWTTSKGKFRVPYGNHYLYKSRPDLGYRSTWFRK